MTDDRSLADGYADIDPPEYDPQAALAAAGFAWAADQIERLETELEQADLELERIHTELRLALHILDAFGIGYPLNWRHRQ